MFHFEAIAGEQRARIACPLSELDATLGDLLARKEKSLHPWGQLLYSRESVPGQVTYYLWYQYQQRPSIRIAAMPQAAASTVFRQAAIPTGSLRLRELSDADTELAWLTPIAIDDEIQAEFFEEITGLLAHLFALCVHRAPNIANAEGEARPAAPAASSSRPIMPRPLDAPPAGNGSRERQQQKPRTVLPPQEQACLEVIHELQEERAKITNAIIAERMMNDKKVYNTKTREPYTDKHIIELKKRLKKAGYELPK